MNRGASQVTLRRSFGRFLIVITLMVAQVGIGGSPAVAATFTVNSALDTVDTTPGDGSCADADGRCTLRAAIQEVNELGGSGHTVSFNISGPGPHTIDISTALPSITVGVLVDATTEPSFSGTPLIILNWAGGATIADGFHISGNGTTIRGFVVQNFTDEGVEVNGDNNIIAGNYVGVRVDGFTADGNDDGILVRGANNMIGGPDAADRNVVGGNADDGISIDSGDDNTIRNNFIGVTADGNGAVSNSGEGIAIQFGATGNVVTGNVISGNGSNGVFVDVDGTGTIIIGNYIGINAGGTSAIANGFDGINADAPGVLIGAAGASNRNVISGNTGHGINLLGGAEDVVIRGNYIGTNSSGTAAIGNGLDGVYADANRAIVGGVGAGAGNLISGNAGDGVRLEKEDQLVQGNLIGTNLDGLLDVGNGGDGIDTGSGTTGGQIGGTSPGAGNIIAFNGGNGVVFRQWSGTLGSVVSNSMFSNDGLGINLYPSGETANTVTPNDPGDTDTDWPNQLLNFPVIDAAGAALGTTYVDFTLDVPSSQWYRIEFFANPLGPDSSGFGEGQTLIGSMVVQQVPLPSGPKTYSVVFPGNTGDVITSTTTLCTGSSCSDFISTSEFSAAVTVGVANNPPVLSAVGSQSGDEGSTITFDADAFDVDSDGMTFSLGGSPPTGASINASTGVFNWATTEAEGPGTYIVRVVVEDNGTPIRSDYEDVEITVYELNEAPVLNPVDQAASEQVELTFVASASDADIPANNLIFSLSPGAPPGATIGVTGDFSWTPDESTGGSQFTFDIRVSDDGSPPETASEQITVTVAETNETPVLAPIGNQTITENNPISFLASATDSDLPANTLIFTLEGAGIPASAVITAGGQFDWTPGEAQGPGIYTFDVVVTDNGFPTEEARETIILIVNEDNLAPILGFIGAQTIQEGVELSFAASASDFDDPVQNLTYTLEGAAPSGASVDPNSGSFTWTPDENDGPGTFVFDVVVIDGGSPNLEDRETITVTVTELNTAPILGPIGNRTISEQTQLTFTAMASDSDDPTNALTFSLIGEPTGASIDPNTGVFSWTPGESQGPGTYVIQVVVTDDGVPARSDSELISVTVLEANQTPVVLPVAAQSGPEQTLISFNVFAFDPDDPANTLTFSLSGAPTGASIDPVTGLFTWIPSESQGPGSHVFDVVAEDDASPSLSAFTSVTVDVSEVNMSPLLISPGNQTGDEGDNITLAIAGSDPDLPANTLSYAATGLPDGLTLNPSTGQVTGTLTRPGNIPTIFTVSITVSDGVGGSDALTFSWTVIPTNLTPTASDDSYSVNEGATLVVPSPGVLGNDSDPEPQVLTAFLLGGPTHGSLVLSTDGSFTYIHTGATDADDSFTYRLSDGNGGFDTAVVEIDVIRINQVPVANPDVVVVDEDSILVFDPRANDSDADGDALAIESISQPAHGTLRVEGGQLRFVPEPNYFGITTGSYTVSDGDGATATASIQITVHPVNDAPVGWADSITLRDYLAASIPVLLNDTDIDGDQLTIASVTGSGIGEVDVVGDLLIFKPPSGWVGTTVLMYTVADPEGATDTVEVSVTVREQTLITSLSLIEDLESGANDLATLGPAGGVSLFSLNPVESVSLMVGAFYQSINAFQLPFVFLGVSMLVLVGLGGATKIPLLLAGRIRNHWSVVLLGREDTLRVHEDPDAESTVLYNFNPTTESVLSIGRSRMVGETEWTPVHTPGGEGWVNIFHLTEQVDVEEFSNDKRPPRLVVEFAETLRAGGDVTSLIADRGIVLALTGPPTTLAQQQFRALLEGARLRMLPTVGGVLQAQEDFHVAVAEPLLAAFDATGEITAGVAHSQTALIPAEVWNFRYLALGEGTSQPWLVFFEYQNGVPRIVGLGIDE